jgi:hypothetical protein
VAALAHHYAEAGTEPEKAARYCRLAAEQAEQRFAFLEAVWLYEQAIACLEQADVPAWDRLELVVRLVRVLARTEQLARARSWRRDALRAARPLSDPALLAQIITSSDAPRIWYSHAYGATTSELVGTVEQTLAWLPPGDQPLRCRLLTTLAFELEGAESERGYQASAQALALARHLGEPSVLAMAINGRFMQTFRRDGLAERHQLGAELLALPGKPVTAEALAHLMLMASSSGAADFGAADRHADQAARVADRYDLAVTASAVGFYRAMRAGLDGDQAGATEVYHQAAAGLDRIGLRGYGTGMSILGRFALLVIQDQVADIASELEQHFLCYPHASAVFAEPYAFALAASGQIAKARAVPAWPQIRRDVLWLFLTGVRALPAITLDEEEHAESAYRALMPYSARPAGADTGVMTLGPTAQILGDLARFLQLPTAEAQYAHALGIAERAHAAQWREAATKRLREVR